MKFLPPTIFGGLAVVVGLLAVVLPETKGTIIPDTIEQLERPSKKKRYYTKISILTILIHACKTSSSQRPLSFMH